MTTWQWNDNTDILWNDSHAILLNDIVAPEPPKIFMRRGQREEKDIGFYDTIIRVDANTFVTFRAPLYAITKLSSLFGLIGRSKKNINIPINGTVMSNSVIKVEGTTKKELKIPLDGKTFSTRFQLGKELKYKKPKKSKKQRIKEILDYLDDV